MDHAASPFPALDMPRNPWSRARVAFELVQAGHLPEAAALVETLRYHPKVPPEVFAAFEAELARQRRALGRPVGPFDGPAEYLGCPDPRLRPPFRRATVSDRVPAPYPPALALPPLAGAGNDTRFLETAAAGLAAELAGRVRRIHAAIAGGPGTDSAALLSALARQDWGGTISATLFDPAPDATLSAPAGIAFDTVAHGLADPGAAPRLSRIAGEADLVLFLDGTVALDADAMARAAHLGAASDRVVQPILPMRTGAHRTPFAREPETALTRFPFRDLRGANMVVPARALRAAGLPDTRFAAPAAALRELAFRLWRAGAWFAPLTVPAMEPAARPGAADEALLTQLCPTPWDRKGGGRFEVPRVGIYIPTYNAAPHIERAVDSVLDQDFEDLEICLADDGSTDGTAELLDRLYGAEPRVRWTTLPNGGIGYASNRAIALSRAPYVGQLDSDDRLKPGAVRRLVEVLDAEPALACAYGSCERIDADNGYVRDEYAWRSFSREKMMITSIVHHFRMFRRSAWERTTRFREDIVNAVDYDIFLKMAEVGPMRHVEEILYQRRWHGANTSNVNEAFQTANTYRVQREALKRQGLARFWDVHVPDPEDPRRVTYRRRADTPVVLFWPDYAYSNPYQHLLYGPVRDSIEICSGDIGAALRMLDQVERPGLVTFHLHWLNALLRGAPDRAEARSRVDAFLEQVEKFVWKGGRLVWTVHNTLSHDSPHADLEIEMSGRIAAAAHAIHVHSAASLPEIAAVFDLPREKVRIAPHGSYVGVYPDHVTRAAARRQLDLEAGDDVILFTGQVRPYKGVEQLVAAFRRILSARPRAALVIAGQPRDGIEATLLGGLTGAERARVRLIDRFVPDAELQLLFRAADLAVYPYQRILTSGSLLLALSFGCPVVIPSVGMTREVLEGREAGMLYDGAGGAPALEAAIQSVLEGKDAGRLGAMQAAARATAEAATWQDIAEILTGRPGTPD